MQLAPAYVRELFAIAEAGKSNLVADALSRKFQNEEDDSMAGSSILLAVSSPIVFQRPFGHSHRSHAANTPSRVSFFPYSRTFRSPSYLGSFSFFSLLAGYVQGRKKLHR